MRSRLITSSDSTEDLSGTNCSGCGTSGRRRGGGNIYTISTQHQHRWGDREIQRFLERNYDMTMRKIELPAETEQLLVPAPVGARELELEEAADVEEADNNHLLSTKVFC